MTRSPNSGGQDRQGDERQKRNGRKPGVDGDHHGDDADRQEQQLDDFDDAAAEEVLDGAHILDAAGDQLAGLGVIVKGERQVVDAVVHGVAEVVPDVGRGPLGEIALDKIEQGNGNPQPEQKKRRAGQIPDLAAAAARRRSPAAGSAERQATTP